MPRDTGIADRLRLFGLTVVEVNGWRERGSADFNPRGSVDHHTAGPAKGNAPSLGIVVKGRPDLPGPLCNVLIGRDNTCYVVAAGRANHAGAGGWAGLHGNSSVFGIEREHVGTAAEKWRLDQFDAGARAHAALISVHGSRWDLVCEHKEWAPRRKIDAFGVDGAVMRDLVRQHLNKTHPSPPPTAKPDQATFLDTVKRAAAGRPTLKDGAKGTWVRDLQSGINAIVGRQVLTVDGQYGPTTGRWVRKFQQDHRLPSNGVVDTATWEALIAARLKKGT